MSILDYFNNVLPGGSLTQQWTVDSYVKIEANRVKYIREHQAELHVAQYDGLLDYLHNRAERKLDGRIVSRPPIEFHRKSKGDEASVPRCSGHLPKIRQTAPDRPDTVARVFQQKKIELVNDIEKRQVLGFATARIHVIEFQKLGLPHCHMLIWIDERDAPATAENVDATICAAIPDRTTHPRLYKSVITHMIHGQGRQVIAVASTGIASTLLLDGTTYHLHFKIYPPITETTRSKIEEASYNAQLIRNASLIISDEATMKTNHALDAINHLFQTVMKNRVDPCGGKVLLLGGDFRQCLPVVRHENRVKVTEATIINKATWPLFRQLRLVQNMRTADGRQDFADWLIQLGNGSLAQIPRLNDPDLIEIPQDFLNIRTNLIEHVFDDPSDLLNEGVREPVCNRAIIFPKNEDCLRINNKIIGEMPGALKVCKSIDTIDSEDPEEISNYPPEILNTFNVSGLPLHQLKLKIGAIVLLLKNIDSRQGLCNGTRLIIKALSGNLIVAEIVAGKHKGQNVFLPRMSMSPTDSDLPFKRSQFPVLVAFVMLINKSQGQTFERVGIYLPEYVFSHGQLYLAFSRATSREGVKIQCEETEKQGKLLRNLPQSTEQDKNKVFTKDVVYKEVLLE
ncbi:ATP-dependent Helicase-like protein [Daphnia magna]|uniref:ATP-dependent DNA helicase n=1 Tax=Daphnia magna TaxID=35525 RepID=A0A164M9P5_9CRUS|nr:ATP-dependent Helicase-like protein [Daphnia magna]